MKKITNKTILKQGDKTYRPVEFDEVICWVDEMKIRIAGCKYFGQGFNGINVFTWHDSQEKNFPNHKGVIISQSKPKLKGIPVISLDGYVERLAESKYEVQSKAFENSTEMFPFDDSGLLKTGFIDGYKTNPNQYTQKDIEKFYRHVKTHTFAEAIEQTNSISVIEVDEQFNIISYE